MFVRPPRPQSHPLVISLRDKLAKLPTSPGVYLFRAADRELLYVGKAVNLRARVRSYFRDDPNHSIKTQELVRRIADVETIVVATEIEALLLEANLIKENRPRFNIRLKDDRGYPHIAVTVQEPLPRVLVTHEASDDGAKYFGPFTDVGLVRGALDTIKRVYTVRSCTHDLPREAPKRPCLDFHIGLCKAPCVGEQSAEEYLAMIRELLDLLSGKADAVRARVEREMRTAADELRYERAAALRDALRGIEAMTRRQRAVKVEGGDYDVVAVARDGARACAVRMEVRDGRLVHREDRGMEGIEEADDVALVEAAARGFYLGAAASPRGDPREILLPAEIEHAFFIEQRLGERARHKVSVHVPARGAKRAMIDLATQNARHMLEEDALLANSAAERADAVLYDLQTTLRLRVVPRLMVCFDISHTGGEDVVASGVVFENGEPCKQRYRRFRIKGDWGNDDFKSMRETVERYFRQVRDRGETMPDLAVIDGGKGQLDMARKALAEAGAAGVALCSLAKRDEEIFRPGFKEPIRLPRRDPGLRLLQRIRDEAHRFANTYNAKLRRRHMRESTLTEFPGIGKGRALALLSHFGSLRAIADAGADGIVAAMKGFPRATAERLVADLQRNAGSSGQAAD